MSQFPIAYGIGARNGKGYAHPECWHRHAVFTRYAGGSLVMGSIVRELSAIPSKRRRCEVCRAPITADPEAPVGNPTP